MPAPLVGVDIVEPERIRDRLAERPSLREELFTSAELVYCDAQFDPALHFAARFAAKEAVVKALALDAFDPRDIEVVATETAPFLRLHGAVAERSVDLCVTLAVSLSHVQTLAVAVVVGVPSEPDRG